MRLNTRSILHIRNDRNERLDEGADTMICILAETNPQLDYMNDYNYLVCSTKARQSLRSARKG